MTKLMLMLHTDLSGGSRISRWGVPSRWGGANLRRGYFSAKMYAKTKELDPVGGRVPAAPPPRSANGSVQSTGYNLRTQFTVINYCQSEKSYE